MARARLNPPNEPLPLDRAVELGRHGGDRRSDKAKEQDSNPILKKRGREYDLARLRRDRPDLAERVPGELSANAAAIEGGFRKKATPFETIAKLAQADLTERAELRRLPVHSAPRQS